MKLQSHKNNLITNVVEAETQEFGIGNASIIMEILQDRLYSNKIQTLTQELISNASDTMKEVGKDNSFEITVPTHLNPIFKVKDTGTGISPERMYGTFIMYGNSTKRNDDNQIGGFGLGCKIPFCYVDSFSIVTIVDGIKRSYVAHQGTTRNGRLDLVSTENTTEQNGTEIQVAVKKNDINEFRDGILRATYFWASKPILKGELNPPTLVRGLTIGNNLEVIESRLTPHYVTDSWSSNPIVVISGIPYELGSALLSKCPTLTKLVNFIRLRPIFHINNGIVEVAASRESIADSDRSKEALEKLATKIFMEVRTHIGDQFKGVKSTSEYFERYQALNEAFNVEKGFAQYKDYQINGEYIQSELFKQVAITEIHCMGKYGRTRVDKITKVALEVDHRKIPLKSFDSLFFLDAEESLVSQNKRIRKYFEGKDRMFMISPLDGQKAIFHKLIKELNVKNFQTITYDVVPKEQRVKIPREKTEFCVHDVTRSGRDCLYTTLADNTDKWLYVTITKDGWDHDVESLKELAYYTKRVYGLRVCGLAERALNMVKGNANFSPLKEWLEKYKPSASEINYVKLMKSTNKETIRTLAKVDGMKDKKLVNIIEEYQSFDSKKAKIETTPEMIFKIAKETKEVKEFVEQDEEIEKLIKKTYPLVLAMSDTYTDQTHAPELVHYINAKYKEK